jgi:hypothetical protein
MENLHKVQIDLSELSHLELLNLTKQLGIIATCSEIADGNCTEEFLSAASQIVAYAELVNK